MAKYIPKIINFCDFGGSKPTFLKTAEKFDTRVQSWETLPHAKFGKNVLRGKLLPKIPILAILGGCKPTFLKPKGLNLR